MKLATTKFNDLWYDFFKIETNSIDLKAINKLPDYGIHSGINIGIQHIFLARVLQEAADKEIFLRNEDSEVLREIIMRALAYPINSVEEALEADTYAVLRRFDHNPKPIESPIRPAEEFGLDSHLENLIESGLVKLPANFFKLDQENMKEAYAQALLHIAKSHFSKEHRIMAIRLIRNKIRERLENAQLSREIEDLTIEAFSSLS